MTKDFDEIEELEMDLLLEAVFRRYGYDFRDYERSTFAAGCSRGSVTKI